MSDELVQIIRSNSSPLDPIPTDLCPKLPHLEGIRAVLFDIYGTLLISGSGDIGVADPSARGSSMLETLREFGIELQCHPDDAYAQFRQVIELHHSRKHDQGIEYPEVDILAVWEETLKLLHQEHAFAEPFPADELSRLAVLFEVRVNPVWEMPGLVASLNQLKAEGLILGIISNAQFFTPLSFPALLEKSLDLLGFSNELRYYSYEHGKAKPGLDLYEMARGGVSAVGVEPAEVLYVGNDMRNDVWPAAQVGFRTALFAGDQRSLRLRQDLQKGQPNPDAIVTELKQIPKMILN